MNKRINKIKLLLLLVIIILTLLIPINVLATNETRANTATSFSGSTLKSIMPGDSWVSGYGAYAKVTLYLATTNDINQGIVYNENNLIDMERTPVTRKDGEPMFVKFGRSIITKIDYTMPQASYVNLTTCKLDTLIDFKKGEKHYPVYYETLTDSQLSDIGVPRWIKYVDGIATNNHASVINYFKGNGNAVTASETLHDIIIEVAEKSDNSEATGFDTVKNILYRTLQNANFSYLDEDGQKVDLSVKIILPTNNNNLANWLIVYEPVINLHQDPNKMFFGDKGGNNFLLTATDAILTNMHSGTPGYPSVVKFFNGAPRLTMQYNHCSICDTTWYGYPDWPHSNLPLALFCPFPCLGVINDYDGVQTTTRNPFLVLSPIRNAAKNFTIEHDWLRYNGGYLFDKPTGDIETPIQNNDEDTILHYGGYSLFVNGPKKESNPNKTVTAVYVRAVVLNNDNTFTTVPIAIELSTKNDLSPTEMIETDTADSST